MLSCKYFVNFLSNLIQWCQYKGIAIHRYKLFKYLTVMPKEEKKMYYYQNSSCFWNDDDNLTTIITKESIFSLAMLIFLFDVNSCDVRVMPPTLTTFMKFWGTCFEFSLHPCYFAFKEGILDSYKIKLYMW